MSETDDHIRQDWVRFLDLKTTLFSDLNIFKWKENLKWRNEFHSGHEASSYWLLKGGLKPLTHLLWYLTDMYCYAVAAETIAKEYEDKGDEGMMGFWRYRVRNYHIYDFIPRYFSFLDHAAHFVASLTEWKLVKGKPQFEKRHTMYYLTFRPILCESLHSSDKIGCLTQDDRKIMYEFLRSMDIEPKDPGLNKIARNYRQDTYPSYFSWN